MAQIPQTLAEQLRRGRVVPFVGAGVSMAVRGTDGKGLFPSWGELLRRGADRLVAEGGSADDAEWIRTSLKRSNPDYLDVARHLREQLGAVWAPFLKEQIDLRKSQAMDDSLALARAVWGLGSQLVVTTNYDRVLRWACPEGWRDDLEEWDVEAIAEQARLLREEAQKAAVWHLHGKIENAAKLILTPDGYRRLYPADEQRKVAHGAALAALRQLLASRTFLFIGFSFADVHLGFELQGIAELFEGHAGPHYALVHRGHVAGLRAKDMPVDFLPFEDFGAPLVERVLELGRALGGTAQPQMPQTVVAPIQPVRNQNPFGDQGKITDPARFFDREDVLDKLFEELGAGRNVSLVGEAQVGKSSVLWQVCQQGPARLGRPVADFVYLDMQSLSGDEDFFDALAEELGLPGKRGWQLKRALGARRVVLCLDEIEKMSYAGFTREVRSQLRGLADGTDAPLTLLVASRTLIAELFEDDNQKNTSPLAPICPFLFLGPFSPDVARRFLKERSTAAGLALAETEIERVVAESGGHPGRIQFAARENWRRALQGEA